MSFAYVSAIALLTSLIAILVILLNAQRRSLPLAALMNRNNRLALLFDAGGIGDFTWNIQRDEVTAHPIVWKLYGCEDCEPKPSGWFRQYQHPDDVAMISAGMTEALEKASSKLDLEFRVRQADGSYKWIASRGVVQRDAQGKPVEVHGLNIDISRRKNAEAAVRASEQQLRLLTEVSPQVLWFNDPAGNIEFFNQQWYDFTGDTNDNSFGRNWVPAIHPDDLPNLNVRWQHALDTAEAYEAEFRVRRKDGVYRWVLARAQAFKDENGKVVRWFGGFTDIDAVKASAAQLLSFSHELELKVAERTTDLLLSNEALLQARTRFQTVLDSATEVAIIALDQRGKIQLFNRGAERMLHYQPSDVVHQHTPYLFLPPGEGDDRAEELSASLGRKVLVEEIFDSALLPQHPYVREAALIRSDGEPVVVRLSVTPMLDTYGRRIGTLKIAVDISDTKRLEMQLIELNRQLVKKSVDAENANRAKSEFLAAMSHEIRTPMNAILGMADLLWETELNGRQSHYVQVFRRAGANLLTLVNDILDLSKIESGHFELEHIEFDLREVVDRTIEMILPKAQAKRIELMSRIMLGTPCQLLGDESRLQQVFINLLGNAVKFTERGEITLTVSADPSNLNRLHFEISDSGIGIPAGKLDTIFEDFMQAETSTTRRFGGTGLGLGICRRLVNRMGGELKVRSEPGKGSTFYFDAVFAHSFQTSARRPEGITGLAGKRVLIIEHNATNRLIFTEMCTSWGMLASQCSEALEVAAALQEADLAQKQFDLVIVDRLMPGIDGFELISLIRSANMKTPILMTTSDSVPGDETRGQQVGIAGYAVKPVRRGELLRLVCKALGQNEIDRPQAVDVVSGNADARATGRILIAEDSEDNRLLFEAYLADTGYRIEYAENGESALKMAIAQTFDLILMDLQMPVMDGLEATKLIRAKELEDRRRPTPVLALTANARLEDIEASLKAGCTAHLSKPISKSKFLNSIHEYILQAS